MAWSKSWDANFRPKYHHGPFWPLLKAVEMVDETVGNSLAVASRMEVEEALKDLDRQPRLLQMALSIKALP